MRATDASRRGESVGEEARSRFREYGAVFMVLLIVGLVTSWRSFGYYWNVDDYHLIRTYSNAELMGTLTDSWDPDSLETSGLRPLTTVFNHVRALAFGESVAAHRAFLLAMYCASLTLLAAVARRVGASRAAVLVGTIAAIGAKNSFYHYVWIADGVHVPQLLLFALSVPLFLSYVETGRRSGLLWTLILAAAGLLVREDSAPALPVLAGLACMHPWLSSEKLFAVRPGFAWRRWLGGVFGMALIFLVYWAWRSAAVADAPGITLGARALRQFAIMLYSTVCLAGGYDPERFPLVGLAGLAIAATLLLPMAERKRAWFWLVAAGISCIPGSMMPRPNLLMFPAAFYGMFLGEVLSGVARRSRFMRAGLTVAGVLVLAMAVNASWLEQLSLHPRSFDMVERDWEMTQEPLASSATIPRVRLEALGARLHALGVDRPDIDFAAWRRELIAAGRVGYRDTGLFVIEQGFMGHGVPHVLPARWRLWLERRWGW